MHAAHRPHLQPDPAVKRGAAIGHDIDPLQHLAIVFGDVSDPDSAVSRLVAERGGFDLMPEMGYAPTNKYLPPRPRTELSPPPLPRPAETGAEGVAGRLLAWVDRALSR